MRSPYGIVEMGDDCIKRFMEKPLLDYYINGGVYCFRKDVASLFKDFEGGDIEKTVFPLLAEHNQFGAYREDGLFWMSIDTTKDLEEIQKEYVNRTDKPWGYEKILINTEKYLTKELFLYEGYQTSFHYHKSKDETMYILGGSGYIEFEDRKEYFGRNDTVRIKPGTPHTIVATESTVLHEVSTPQLDDTIRIRDYYER
jgi:NDP-sugar pyrophosphorylase family protein